MQATPTTQQHSYYVHKLRLEAHEGALVEIRSLEMPMPTRGHLLIVGKLIGAGIAAASLLGMAALQLVR